MANGAAGSLAEARSHNVPAEAFLKHYREIRDCRTAHQDTGMALARAKKAAKAIGIDLDALRLLEKMSDLDTDEAEMQLRHFWLYAKWAKLPIGMQSDMFGAPPQPAAVDAKAAEEHAEWQAGEDGLKAGKAGHERDSNPHDIGSAEYAAWVRSWKRGHKVWLDGQKEIASEMGEASEHSSEGNGAAPPPTRKRGRPPNAAKTPQQPML